MKKDTLLKGTLILAAAALVARALGIFQRVPLDYLMGEVGKGYFTVANNLYLLLLVVATAGIPSAISKMVSAMRRCGETLLWIGIISPPICCLTRAPSPKLAIRWNGNRVPGGAVGCGDAEP